MITYSAELDPLDCGAFKPTWVVRVIAKDSFGNKHEVLKRFAHTLWGAKVKAHRLLWRRRRYAIRINKAVTVR